VGTLTPPAGFRGETRRVTNARQHVRFTVDVDPASEPMEGVLSHAEGPDQPFIGWTAFVRAVEVALDLGRRRLDTPPPNESMRGKP
jgi:hypothetical protein